MQAELDALESKIAQILERYQGMREENVRLRQQLVAMENSNKQLTERLGEARTRIESLLTRDGNFGSPVRKTSGKACFRRSPISIAKCARFVTRAK